jgi:competence protein ComEC
MNFNGGFTDAVLKMRRGCPRGGGDNLKIKFLSILLTLALLLSSCAWLNPAAPVSGDGLTVTFLDVGQADATLVECGGMTMLIDGGSPGDSDLIYTVLKNKGITHLDYIIATHPHADHIGGIAGALRFASAGTVYSPVTEYDTRTFSNFIKAVEGRNAWLTIPNPPEYFNLGEAFVEILAPLAILPDDPNNSSIALKITYGSTSFLFTGDAEREAETALFERYGGILSSTVLKVGHHGSNTSTIYPFLREVMPDTAVISCGKGNSYGHPHENVLSRLRDAGVTVYRTDLQGDIICYSDGQSVTVTTQRGGNIQTNPTVPETARAEEYYIGNINSLKLHRPSCSSLPAEHNQEIYDNRETAIEDGYEPCGSCKP